MKKLTTMIAVVLFIAMVLGITACTGPTSATQPSSTTGTTGPVQTTSTPEATIPGGEHSITIWHGSWWEAQVPMIETDFAKKYPGYTVKVELMPIANYLENAATAILGGNSPDVLTLDTLMLPTMISRGLIEPLDDMIAANGVKKEDFVEVLYNAGVKDGKTYALPYRYTASSLFYNKTLFDKANVAYPTDRMSFEDFRIMCEKMTSADYFAYGIAASKNDPANVMTSFAPFLWGFNGDFLTEDLTKAALDTPESIKAIDYWVKLYTDKLVPEGCINYAITADLFPLAMNQSIAMIPMNDSNIVKIDTFAKEAGFEWGVVLHPGLARAAGWSFTIPISAKDPAAAEVYINWFLQPEVVSANTVVLPGVLSAQKLGKWSDPLYNIFSEQATYSKHCPATPAWTQIQTIVTEELQNALTGQITSEEAAKEMSRRINEIL